MKLAEALYERAALQKQIHELGGRLCSCSQVQEGETPPEDPKKLLAELEESFTRLEELVGRINHTNSVTTIDGDTLTTLLARRDCLAKRIRVYGDFLSSASTRSFRVTKSELRTVPTVSVAEYRKVMDQNAEKLRKLDIAIQNANWTTDLL